MQPPRSKRQDHHIAAWQAAPAPVCTPCQCRLHGCATWPRSRPSTFAPTKPRGAAASWVVASARARRGTHNSCNSNGRRRLSVRSSSRECRNSMGCISLFATPLGVIRRGGTACVITTAQPNPAPAAGAADSAPPPGRAVGVLHAARIHSPHKTTTSCSQRRHSNAPNKHTYDDASTIALVKVRERTRSHTMERGAAAARLVQQSAPGHHLAAPATQRRPRLVRCRVISLPSSDASSAGRGREEQQQQQQQASQPSSSSSSLWPSQLVAGWLPSWGSSGGSASNQQQDSKRVQEVSFFLFVGSGHPHIAAIGRGGGFFV